jgi:hypothetical protein
LKVWTVSSGSDTTLKLEPSVTWVTCNPAECASSGESDPQVITVRVNRYGLPVGEQQGVIRISAVGNSDIKTLDVPVSMMVDSTTASRGWVIKNVYPAYAAPSLLEFTFSLRDMNDHAVVADPSELNAVCMEDGKQITTPWYLARASDKKLKCMLVLDFTEEIQKNQTNGAASVINAAKILLASLGSDTEAALYEFHSTVAPEMLSDGFTVDKENLRARLDALAGSQDIAPPGPSNVWTALDAAVSAFPSDAESIKNEARTLILVSAAVDGSGRDPNPVITKAKQQNIAIYAVAVGAKADTVNLRAMTETTGGEYYPAANTSELEAKFNLLVQDLGGQFMLRWATLNEYASFTPSFAIEDSAGRRAAFELRDNPFSAPTYVGQRNRGELQLTAGLSEGVTLRTLRANYMPANVVSMKLKVTCANPWEVEKISGAEGGLCSLWTVAVAPGTADNIKEIVLTSPNPADWNSELPMASFGPLLVFRFSETIADPGLTVEVTEASGHANTPDDPGWPFLVVK